MKKRMEMEALYLLFMTRKGGEKKEEGGENTSFPIEAITSHERI